MKNRSNCFTGSPGSFPNIKEIDGDSQITAAGFEWRPPVDEVENGRLEFNVAGDDPEGFFPVEVHYQTQKTFCSVDVHYPLSYTPWQTDTLFRADSDCRLRMSVW